MREAILLGAACLALGACDNSQYIANNTTYPGEQLNVVGTDRCGEPIYEGREPLNKNDGTPCK